MESTELTLKIKRSIHFLRGSHVMLDNDLALLYEVETKHLNQAVKRNIEHFPPDFMFKLTRFEFEALQTKYSFISSGQGKHRKYLPIAFTGEGISMLFGIIKSPRAIEIRIAINRAFRDRQQISSDHFEIKVKFDEQSQRQIRLEDKIDSLKQEFLQKFNDFNKQATLIKLPSEIPTSDGLINKLYDVDRSNIEKCERIFRFVCNYYKIERQKLLSQNRTKNISIPRHVAMYLCRTLTSLSFREIADCFNRKDHTTVLHAHHKILDALDNDFNLREDVTAIRNSILGGDSSPPQ